MSADLGDSCAYWCCAHSVSSQPSQSLGTRHCCAAYALQTFALLATIYFISKGMPKADLIFLFELPFLPLTNFLFKRRLEVGDELTVEVNEEWVAWLSPGGKLRIYQ